MLNIRNNDAGTNWHHSTIGLQQLGDMFDADENTQSPQKTGFMPTTSVSTPFGWRSVGSIVEGDEVLARDGTVQVVSEVRKTSVNMYDIMDETQARPVRIPAQSLGNMTELCVLPDQMLHVPSPVASLARSAGTRLVKASDLVGVYGIRQLDHEEMQVSISLVFEQETVISCAHGGFAICDGDDAIEKKSPVVFYAA